MFTWIDCLDIVCTIIILLCAHITYMGGGGGSGGRVETEKVAWRQDTAAWHFFYSVVCSVQTRYANAETWHICMKYLA